MGEKLERRQAMQPVHSVIGNIQTLTRKNAGAVTTFLGRKMWSTLKASYPAGATEPLFLEAFYSPDGQNYDTSPLFSTFLPAVAGSVEQITQCFNCIPEVGTIKIEIYNSDAAQVDNVEVWIGISKWDIKNPKERET